MSNITTIYDELLVEIAAIDTTKQRIPNPESLSDNPRHYLVNGWGLIYSGATLTDGEFKNIVETHTFNVVFTREVLKTDQQTTQVDTSAKALLEDAITMKKVLFNVDQMGIATAIRQNNIGTTSPIEFVAGDKLNFRSITIEFLVDIAETL